MRTGLFAKRFLRMGGHLHDCLYIQMTQKFLHPSELVHTSPPCASVGMAAGGSESQDLPGDITSSTAVRHTGSVPLAVVGCQSTLATSDLHQDMGFSYTGTSIWCNG